jgi:hypothetical protein
MSLYTELSRQITETLKSKDKSKDGIFFTPPSIIERTIDIIKKVNIYSVIKTILEPSCGSCEFIHYLDKNFKGRDITGIEKNDYIYDKIKDMKFSKNKVKLFRKNYLEFTTDKKYDLIIGNPPYFVMKKKEVDKRFLSLFDGRPNIFILFIIHSFDLLNNDGILSFVLPKNFMNCLYYDKLRGYIYKNYTILHIEDCKDDDFLETNQETIIFIIQKNHRELCNDKYTTSINNCKIFNTVENTLSIKELYKKSTSMNKLGFDVKVGNIVWNQNKDILSSNEKYTRLIYSSDIKNNNLDIVNYKNDDKKNYIIKEGITEPILVLNRGYGKGKYHFNYCLIDIPDSFLIENHLICIRYTEKISKTKLLKLYESLIKSFDDPRTMQFVDTYFCNNAINTNELKHILPIYE